MEQATEEILSNPTEMLKKIEQATGEMKGESKDSPREAEGADISGEDPGVPLASVKEALKEVKVKRPGMSSKAKGKLPATVRLPHAADNVDQWVRESLPNPMTLEDSQLSDTGAQSDIEERVEPPLSDMGSVRSEIVMLKVWFEEQMQNTHAVLAKMEHRIALLEQRSSPAVTHTRAKSSRDLVSTSPPSTSSGKAPKPVQQLVFDLPKYSPILVVQRRLIAQLAATINMRTLELVDPIPKSDWNKKTLSSLMR